MPLSTLRKVWLVVAIAALLLSLDLMVATLGWPPFLQIKNVIGIGLPEGVAKPISGYFAIIFLTPLLLAGCWLTLLHARQARFAAEARWPARLLDFGTQSPPGRAWALLTGLVFGLFPLYALGHAWNMFRSHVVLCEEGAAGWNAVARGWSVMWYIPRPFDLESFLTSKTLRIGSGCEPAEIARAVYALPIIAPTFLLPGLALVVVLAVRAAMALRA
ncbi:hypothetical protein [Pararhodobacter sp. SW119]|uniref:hypothetical protein n=1 Tax=Pararhodobacter sp. SW119 TaxID=2780075 RepID=UPI001ADFE75F|nr:hypothetical protein [Pararhodobacter sp. SW119]